ncbi:hypothetical protein ABBQ38_004779 [Trebouxia sp. C0009 RCD-2024]
MDSPLFTAACQSEDNEGCGCTLHITDTDDHTMDLLLEWVYGGLQATPSLPETEALKRCILVCSLEEGLGLREGRCGLQAPIDPLCLPELQF